MTARATLSAAGADSATGGGCASGCSAARSIRRMRAPPCRRAGAAAAAAGSGLAAGLARQPAEAARRHGAAGGAAGLGAARSPTGGGSWRPTSRRRWAPATPPTRCGRCGGGFRASRFVWLMGADNLAQLPRWRRWRDIAAARAVCGAAPAHLQSPRAGGTGGAPAAGRARGRRCAPAWPAWRRRPGCSCRRRSMPPRPARSAPPARTPEPGVYRHRQAAAPPPAPPPNRPAPPQAAPRKRASPRKPPPAAARRRPARRARRRSPPGPARAPARAPREAAEHRAAGRAAGGDRRQPGGRQGGKRRHHRLAGRAIVRRPDGDGDRPRRPADHRHGDPSGGQAGARPG